MWFKTWSSEVWHEAVPSALEDHVSARCGALHDVEPAHMAEQPPPGSECRQCVQAPAEEKIAT